MNGPNPNLIELLRRLSPRQFTQLTKLCAVCGTRVQNGSCPRCTPIVAEVVRLRTHDLESEWRVSVNNRITSPSFESRGAADVYRRMILDGRRKPEYPR